MAARADKVILVMLAATFTVNGAAVGFGRLLAQRLVSLGLLANPDPIVWFASIAPVAAALDALSLRLVEKRIDGSGVARRTYVGSCVVGVLGLLGFAQAPCLLARRSRVIPGVRDRAADHDSCRNDRRQPPNVRRGSSDHALVPVTRREPR